MKRAIVMAALMSLVTSASISAQRPVQESDLKLYSVIKHRGENRKSCINFKVALTGPVRFPCDLGYGFLNAGEELDWFRSSGIQGDRTVIRDLGALEWSANFSVPVVEPLTKLKPGERREVKIDASGGAGEPGQPGGPQVRVGSERSSSSLLSINDGPLPGDISPASSTPQPLPKPARPKHDDGKPKVDPSFVKVIAGHIYVIHVVDDSRDLYALVRVEALERGDNCTVSWKLIPEPLNQTSTGPSR
jgi:hypothetical protein